MPNAYGSKSLSDLYEQQNSDIAKQAIANADAVDASNRKAKKAQEDAAAQAKLDKEAADRAALDKNIEYGKSVVGNLGRLSTDVNTINTKLDENQSADTQDVLARRRASLAGLTPEQLSAQRGQAAESFGRNEETNRRRLAAIQANLGVRGDSAATQQSGQLVAGQQQRTNYERDLLLANRQIQDQALNAYDISVRNAEGQQQQAKLANIQTEQFNASQMLKQRELEKFNLQQAARERFGAIGVGFGLSQQTSASESLDKQLAAQVAAAQAQSSGGK